MSGNVQNQLRKVKFETWIGNRVDSVLSSAENGIRKAILHTTLEMIKLLIIHSSVKLLLQTWYYDNVGHNKGQEDDAIFEVRNSLSEANT